ncbi:MAG: hypothetical protein EXR86_14430 [Gammaproteobacteria bacterium]|nr:hypothetical protein [Gammaproteobacteria bacterium]
MSTDALNAHADIEFKPWFVGGDCDSISEFGEGQAGAIALAKVHDDGLMGGATASAMRTHR